VGPAQRTRTGTSQTGHPTLADGVQHRRHGDQQKREIGDE